MLYTEVVVPWEASEYWFSCLYLSDTINLNIIVNWPLCKEAWMFQCSDPFLTSPTPPPPDHRTLSSSQCNFDVTFVCLSISFYLSLRFSFFICEYFFSTLSACYIRFPVDSWSVYFTHQKSILAGKRLVCSIITFPRASH